MFVLLLPEEPAAELLAWPVEEEFGFLDLLILATVLLRQNQNRCATCVING